MSGNDWGPTKRAADLDDYMDLEARVAKLREDNTLLQDSLQRLKVLTAQERLASQTVARLLRDVQPLVTAYIRACVHTIAARRAREDGVTLKRNPSEPMKAVPVGDIDGDRARRMLTDAVVEAVKAELAAAVALADAVSARLKG